jgi:membrane-bound lytic murein transglycosylase D
MVKNLLFVFIIFFFVSSDPFFGEKSFWSPSTEENDPSNIVTLPWATSGVMDKYLSDPDDRIIADFKIPPYFEASTKFWFLIYTQFSSHQIVLHDRDRLSLIYRVLDFKTLKEKNLNRMTLYNLQKKLTKENIDEIKSGYDKLIQNPFLRDQETGLVLNALHQANISLPDQAENRIELFKNLRSTIRSQTGQADYIQQGLVRSSPYKEYLHKIFEARGLPDALLAIPFLESSFNPLAESKVGALGVWQFMPFISRHYLPKHNNIDYRENIILSSLAASFLLQENLKILKRWDLAVTAYNSGTKHLVKMRRSLAAEDLDLALIIENSDSENFGFASKNFYSEYLALVHTLAYRDEINEVVREEDEHQDVKDFYIYQAKCTIRLNKDLKLSTQELEKLMGFNHHLNSAKPIHRATIVTSPFPLSTRHFQIVDLKTITKVKPKDWIKGLKSYSCSTR